MCDIGVERYMAAAMATYVTSIEPDSAFVVDCAEAGEHSVLFCFLVRGAWVLDLSLVPDHFVDLLLVNARGWALEDIWHLDGSLGVWWDSLDLPLLIETLLCVVEGKVPRPVERCPWLAFSVEVRTRVGVRGRGWHCLWWSNSNEQSSLNCWVDRKHNRKNWCTEQVRVVATTLHKKTRNRRRYKVETCRSAGHVAACFLLG
jgi:hypothetical protein